MFKNQPTKRTTDIIYLSEDRKDNPKEYFKFLAKINNICSLKEKTILDIGCATGEFIHYLHSQNSHLQYTGIDIFSELIERAKLTCPYADFYVSDIMESTHTHTHTHTHTGYDIVFANGIMSIFDDFELFISNAISYLNDNGVLNIFSIFNPEDLDVIVKSKRYHEDAWEKGWNIFSIKSVSTFLNNRYNYLRYEFIPWNIIVDIPKTDNPYRSYTINLGNNDKMVVNGLQILHNFYLLRIQNREKGLL